MEFERENDQLNMDLPSEEPTYDVADIIAEFGSQAEARAENNDEDEVVRIWSPKQQESEPAEEEPEEPQPSDDAEAPEDVTDTEDADEADKSEEAEAEEATDAAPALKLPRIRHPSVFSRFALLRANILDEEREAAFLTPEEARSAYL